MRYILSLKNRRFVHAIIILFLCFTFSSLAVFPLSPNKKVHSYLLSKWDVSDGLPNNSVKSIIQTKDHYLWLGTERGLVRFDGIKFTIFSPMVRNNKTVTLLEDSKNNLYFGTRGGGLGKISGGKIEHFYKEDGANENCILSLFEDSKKNIWISTFFGLSKINSKGSISNFDISDNFKDKTFTAIAETTDGRIWLGSDHNGIYSISGDIINHYSIKRFPSNISIKTFLVDHKGKLWVGTKGRGIAYLRDNKFIPYEKNSLLSGKVVFSLFEDSDENIWIGTTKGLNRMSDGNINRWNSSSVMSKIIVESITEDHEKSLWIGTNNSGLFRLQDGKFDSLSTIDGLSDNRVTCVFEDSRGGIWIGTNGNGLNHISSLKNGTVKILSSKDGILSDFISSSCEDSEGDIWIGTDKGITIIDKLTLSVKKNIFDKKTLPNNEINVLYRGIKGDVWAGTIGGGLVHFSEDKTTVYSTKDGLSNDFIHAIYQDKDEVIWIGTHGGGVDRLLNGSFTNYNSNSGLINNFVFTITGDEEGNIWLGTGGGLSLIKKNRMTPLNDDSLLFSNTIHKIFFDNNNLWLTSNIGLFKIEKADLEKYFKKIYNKIPFRLFDSKDGLNSDECIGGIQPAGYKSLSGKLLIPTTRGIAIFDPKINSGNNLPPKVYIEKVETNHPYLLKKGLAIFPSNTKKVKFHFTALSLLVPERIKFKVKLSGFDKDWVEIKDSRNRSISYTNLSAGKYSFSVAATNSDGVWTDNRAVFNFMIKSHFYSSPIFQAILGILAIALFIYFYSVRIKQVRKYESELQNIVDERTKELRLSNIRLTEANEQKSELLSMAAHDLKNPLQAIIGFSELISLMKECPDNVKKNSHLILEASRGMLETINNTLNTTVIKEGKVTTSNKEIIDLTELSRLIVDIYSEFAKKKNQIVITRFWSNCYIKGEKERIKIVVENLLSNAIKYSPLNKNIILSVEKSGKNIIISVKDEGSGFSDEDKKKIFEKFRRLSSKPTGGESSTGIGLSIVKKIVEMHNGKIWLESKAGEGSIFFVSFPAVDPVDTWKVK